MSMPTQHMRYTAGFIRFFPGSLLPNGSTVEGKQEKTRDTVGHRGLQLERVKGIEPSYQAWEAGVLPLNYTRAL